MEIEVFQSGSKGNCYKIKSRDTSLLLEAGIPYKKIQEKLAYKLSEIDFCLLTHSHKDHSLSVRDLIKRGLDVYMSQGTKEDLSLKDNHRIKILEKDKKGYKRIDIKDFYIYPFSAIHDVNEPVNYYLVDRKSKEGLMFVTDTGFIRYKIPENTSYLMVECNYVKEKLDRNSLDGKIDRKLRDRIVKNHMGLETLLEALRAAKLKNLKRVYVLHLSDKNADGMLIKSCIQEVTGVETYIC